MWISPSLLSPIAIVRPISYIDIEEAVSARGRLYPQTELTTAGTYALLYLSETGTRQWTLTRRGSGFILENTEASSDHSTPGSISITHSLEAYEAAYRQRGQNPRLCAIRMLEQLRSRLATVTGENEHEFYAWVVQLAHDTGEETGMTFANTRELEQALHGLIDLAIRQRCHF